MSTERLGLNGSAVQNRQFYDMLLLHRATPNFVYLNWGKKTPIPARMGNSVNWRRLEAITTSTTALTEGTRPSITNVTWTSVAATVAQYGQFSFHSDVIASQAIDPVVSEMVEAYGMSMSDALDQVTRNVIVAGTTVQFATTATSRGDLGSGDYMSLAEINEAVSTLRNNNALPIVDGLYIGIIHPFIERDLKADSDIISILSNAGVRGGDNPLFKGVLGDIAGVRFIVTSNARVFSSEGLSGADVHGTMILGKEFYGITEFGPLAARTYVKAPGSAGAQDPLDQFGSVGWKASLAVARLNENFAVRIESISSSENAS